MFSNQTIITTNVISSESASQNVMVLQFRLTAKSEDAKKLLLDAVSANPVIAKSPCPIAYVVNMDHVIRQLSAF